MSRILVIAMGGLAGLLLTLTMAWLMQEPQHPAPASPCTRYPTVTGMWICGTDVYLIDHHRKQWLGPLQALAPMPKPPPFKPRGGHHT